MELNVEHSNPKLVPETAAPHGPDRQETGVTSQPGGGEVIKRETSSRHLEQVQNLVRVFLRATWIVIGHAQASSPSPLSV